ncbi:LCP family protein [Nonomuraea sp. NPDC046570]|uniref:LCP family protein n=1 Tax=Nonomuraea sp. NPDC046570 TaxID=3155255 RepID=UPI0033DE4E27
MDDLRMLRDLGDELEQEPPASLVRQRARMAGGGRTRPRLRGWTVLAAAAALTAAVAAVPIVLIGGPSRIGLLRDPGIEHVPAPSGTRPATVSKVLNVLLVGTDSEAGSPSRRMGARSDTMIILHLSADRSKAVAVSIPRDSVVDLPSCGPTPAQKGMINSAYNTGGLTCAWKAVEATTGVRLDHAVEMNFSGFKDMVNAVGGVEVTLPRAVDDRQAKLKLPAGKHLLSGKQALGYVRLRRYGDGSDLQRIKRQQAVMKRLASKARALVTDPAKLDALLVVARKWVKTDENLDLGVMRDLAEHTKNVTFVTVPWIPDPGDPNRVQWHKTAAPALFKSLREG